MAPSTGAPGAEGPRLGPADQVAVTGAAGFIGSAIVRRLLERQVPVVALVEPNGEEINLAGLEVERRPADVRDAPSVAEALAGCRAVFHTAARYGFWDRRPERFYDVNVVGTRNVLAAAERAGCERVVYTSTVGTLGLQDTTGAGSADEDAYAHVDHLFGPYKQSKYVAEHEVLRAGAQGLPVTLVLPTFPLGPGDRRPTPTGKVVLDYLNGRMPAYVDTVLNVAHVDDLAQGHLQALEHGRVGRSYICGGENMTMRHLLEVLAGLTGLGCPRVRVPRAVAVGVARVSEVVEGRWLGRDPSVPLEAARMSTTTMRFDDARARRELGYRSRPPVEAIAASARWFLENGYVAARRAAAIRWSEQPPVDPVPAGPASTTPRPSQRT
jgi:dihydroflavonol-4-reductase